MTKTERKAKFNTVRTIALGPGHFRSALGHARCPHAHQDPASAEACDHFRAGE